MVKEKQQVGTNGDIKENKMKNIIIGLVLGFVLTLPFQVKAYNDAYTEWQQEVSDKLERDSLKKFEDNLWNNVCPLCKKDMELHTYGTYDQFSDHWCIHCGFITKC